MRNFSRWSSLVGGIYLSMACAVPNSFSVFSPLLTDKFNLTLTEVNWIATVGIVGMYFTLPAGYIFDNYKATVTIAIGMLFSTIGYSLMFLFICGWFGPNINPILFALCFALGSQSQGYFDTTGLCTNIKNFPGSDVKVIGIQKAANGLGAAVFAAIYEGFCQRNKTLFVGLIPAIVLLLSTYALVTVNVVSDTKTLHVGKKVNRGFNWLYAISLIVAFYTLVTTIVESQFTFGNTTYLLIAIGLIGLLLVFQLVPNIIYESKDYLWEGRTQVNEVAITPTKNEISTVMDKILLHSWLNPDSTGDLSYLERSYRLGTTIWTPELWLFFLICFSVTGSGLMVINNISQMDKALRHKNCDATQSALVSLNAFGSATGRMGFGYLQALSSGRVSKAFWAIVVSFIMTCSMVWLAYSSPNMLFPGSLLCGWAYGGLWVILPTLAKAMFGIQYLGQNCNFLNFAPMCGCLFCSTYIAGRNYDIEASKQDNDASNLCYGSVCYRRTFLILALINGVAFMVSIFIFPRFFKRAVQKRTEYQRIEGGYN